MHCSYLSDHYASPKINVVVTATTVSKKTGVVSRKWLFVIPLGAAASTRTTTKIESEIGN